jgi:hypothetical protein
MSISRDESTDWPLAIRELYAVALYAAEKINIAAR